MSSGTLAPPRSGNGWHMLERPYAHLEALARHVWNLAFHAIPWPTGWQVRWANCGGALGLCDRDAKLILIDEHRCPHELFRTISHELVHVTHPNESHGAGFRETWKRVERHMLQDMPAIDAPWYREPVKVETMSIEHEDEYDLAMVKSANGAPVSRTALRSLDLARKALAEAGGFPPRTMTVSRWSGGLDRVCSAGGRATARRRASRGHAVSSAVRWPSSKRVSDPSGSGSAMSAETPSFARSTSSLMGRQRWPGNGHALLRWESHGRAWTPRTIRGRAGVS